MEGSGVMREYTLPRGGPVNRYQIHQVLAALVGGKHGIFAIDGDTVRFRSEQALPLPYREIEPPAVGQVSMFSLTVSCYTKLKGFRRYYHPDDQESRLAWINRKSAPHGFRIVAVKITATSERIKTFDMDVTTFSGHLEVTDAALFRAALLEGISGGGSRAFGFGYLAI